MAVAQELMSREEASGHAGAQPSETSLDGGEEGHHER